MAVLLTPPYLQFFDDNGDPLSGGKIYTYAAGTLTPKATYTDASETTPLPNPIILDSAGRATIWISGSYYIDVKTSADVAVKNTDNITSFNTSSSSINSLLPTQAGNAGKSLVTDGSNVSWQDNVGSIIRNHIDGYQMSTAGSSTTMTIGAGQAADSASAAYITLASSINKTTGAWAVGSGNGGLDTGTIANNTWYYFYAIRRPDTGVVDVICSTNATSPTLPTNYTQFRYIGAGLTNGSAQWTQFVQDGDTFDWFSSVLDVSSNNPGTSAVTRALTVPPRSGINAKIQSWVTDSASAGGVNNGFIISSLDVEDAAPTLYTSTTPNSDTGGIASASNIVGALWSAKTVRTNSSRQVRSRLAVSDANKTLYIRTLGWIDTRGKQ